ncbi:hypothetical protein ABPG77_009140 [Micractinium sp. CCAP 211/92]
MGLLKHKGQKKTPLVFTLHIHALDWPRSEDKSLVVVAQRGSHSAATGRVRRPRRAAQRPAAALTFWRSSCPCRSRSSRMPRWRARAPLAPSCPRSCALGGAARRRRRASRRGPFLGSVALNLADYASAEGRTVQQAFTLAPVGARLLVTIGVWARGQKRGGLPGVEPSLTSLEAELEEGGAAELPISMSTDEEGSRPSSAAGRSRPGSSAAVRGVDSLAAVPEEHAGGAAAAAAYPSGPPGLGAQGLTRHAQVLRPCRPLPACGATWGSALERAEASEAGSRTGDPASMAQAAEVQSRPAAPHRQQAWLAQQQRRQQQQREGRLRGCAAAMPWHDAAIRTAGTQWAQAAGDGRAAGRWRREAQLPLLPALPFNVPVWRLGSRPDSPASQSDASR